MSRPIFLVSAAMTAGGVVSAIQGIGSGYAQPIGVGLVLILGGAVFALLYVGMARGEQGKPHGED
jgi:hypothetical protein